METRHLFWSGLFALGLSAICWAAQQLYPQFPRWLILLVAAFGFGVIIVSSVGWLAIRSSQGRRSAHDATMPLYEVLRHVGQRSTWAARYNPKTDGDWLIDLSSEFRAKLAAERLVAWGTWAPVGGVPDSGISKIASDFWRRCELDIHELVLGREPPTDVRQRPIDGGDGYRDVRFVEAEVRAAWPRRTFWARLLGHSPAERTHAVAEWKKVDAELRLNGLHLRPGEGWRQRTSNLNARDQGIVAAILQRLSRRDASESRR